MRERKEIIIFIILSLILHSILLMIPYFKGKKEERELKKLLQKEPITVEFVHQKPDSKVNEKAKRLSYENHYAEKETRRKEVVAHLPSQGIEVERKGEEEERKVGMEDRLFRGFENSDDLNLPEEDTVNLNTREFRYISYFAKLKSKIELVWNYPSLSIMRGEQGTVKLKFTIRADGTLEDVKVIESSGYTLLDEEAVRAVKVASPYPPFPPSWGLKRLHIIGEFNYILGYRLVR